MSGYHSVGGLVGLLNASTVSNSYSTVSVSGTNFYIGGLVGTNSYSTVSNSYSTGTVSGDLRIGGLVGYNESSTVNNSYSTGSVSGNYVGGLVGENLSSTVNNSFWDTVTSGQGSSDGGTGKTTAEMTTDALVYNYTTNIYLAAGWDFKGESINGTDNIWNIGNSRNNGYPYLDWEYPDDPATLPVELSSFTAVYTKNESGNDFVTVNWETASETDVNGFNI